MDDSFFTFHSDPSKWVSVRTLLQELLDDLPDVEWRPGVRRPATLNPLAEREHYQSELKRAYEPHAQSVRSAAGERILSGTWPESLPEPTVFYLHLTLQCCQLFLMLTCPRLNTGAYSTVIPFPNSTPEEVALWLIVEWWDNAGYYLYLRDTTSDEAIFSQQFRG